MAFTGSLKLLSAPVHSFGGASEAFEFFANDNQLYTAGVKAPRSNCILDATRLLGTGVRMRTVDEAFDAALSKWTPTKA